MARGPKTREGIERIAAMRRARRGIPINAKRRTANEIFWSNCLPLRGRCWPWLGCRDPRGYGRFGVQFKKGKTKISLAHRYSYVFHKGEIPPRLTIDHLCRNTSCVNPSHLEAVTTGVNTLRGNALSAINARKTHCKNGHDLADAFLKLNKRTGRYMRICRICRRAYGRMIYRRERAENSRKV